jgi:hypothetical protein
MDEPIAGASRKVTARAAVPRPTIIMVEARANAVRA